MNGKRARELHRMVQTQLIGRGRAASALSARQLKNRIKKFWFSNTGQNPKPLKVRTRKQTKVVLRGVGKPKRPWREGEPLHVLRPIRAARLAQLSAPPRDPRVSSDPAAAFGQDVRRAQGGDSR